MALPEDFDIAEFVARVFAEDLGSGGDVTSAATIAEDERFAAVMTSRQDIVVAGLDLAAAFFRELDPSVEIARLCRDGDAVAAGSELMHLSGNARAMLAAERPALNTMQHLSGIATLTRRYRRGDRRHRRDADRHAQDVAGAARSREICGADGRRFQSPDAPRRRRSHQGQSCRRVRRSRRSCEARQGGEHRLSGPGRSRFASRRSNRRWRRGRTACFSTTCRRRCFARRWRWSPGECRSRHPEASISTPSGALPRRASTSFRRAGSRNRRLPST